jgi:hypothetical protein
MSKRVGKENKATRTLADSSKPHPGAVQQRAAVIQAQVSFLAVPRDEDDWRFAQSFEPGGDKAAARPFLPENGFVVFRNELTPAETAESCREILAYAEHACNDFDASDDQTWGAWRSQQHGMPPPDEAAWWQPQWRGIGATCVWRPDLGMRTSHAALLTRPVGTLSARCENAPERAPRHQPVVLHKRCGDRCRSSR